MTSGRTSGKRNVWRPRSWVTIRAAAMSCCSGKSPWGSSSMTGEAIGLTALNPGSLARVEMVLLQAAPHPQHLPAASGSFLQPPAGAGRRSRDGGAGRRGRAVFPSSPPPGTHAVGGSTRWTTTANPTRTAPPIAALRTSPPCSPPMKRTSASGTAPASTAGPPADRRGLRAGNLKLAPETITQTHRIMVANGVTPPSPLTRRRPMKSIGKKCRPTDERTHRTRVRMGESQAHQGRLALRKE